MNSIELLDLFVIVGYLLGIVLIGLLSVRKKNRTSEGYFWQENHYHGQ